jgi:hypothetical protein
MTADEFNVLLAQLGWSISFLVGLATENSTEVQNGDYPALPWVRRHSTGDVRLMQHFCCNGGPRTDPQS